MTEHEHAELLIRKGHWVLKLAFIMGVGFTGLLLLGEVVSMPGIGTIISGLLPYDVCEGLRDHEHHFPWASFLLILLLIAPFTIGQARASRLMERFVDKLPGAGR